jgi:hypothetical protein
MESDWKLFSGMAPKLRERYLAERNARIVALLTNPKKNETERFWEALEVMEKEAKILQKCLDGHSRSKMWMFMMTMISVGMLKQEDMAGFSEELRKEVSAVFDHRM